MCPPKSHAQMPITALPTDVLSLILAQLSRIRNIKAVKRTCRAFRNASPGAEQVHRRVCFEHSMAVMCVAAAARRGARVVVDHDESGVAEPSAAELEQRGQQLGRRAEVVVAAQ